MPTSGCQVEPMSGHWLAQSSELEGARKGAFFGALSSTESHTLKTYGSFLSPKR